jgi:hypothetical protein
MESAALPCPADTKMMSNTYPMAHAASQHACGEDGCLKHPHPRIIDGDNRVVGWLVVGCWLDLVLRHLTRHLPR